MMERLNFCVKPGLKVRVELVVLLRLYGIAEALIPFPVDGISA